MVDQVEDTGEFPGGTELLQPEPVKPEPTPHSAEDTTLHLRTELARYLQNLQGLVSKVSSSCCRTVSLSEHLQSGSCTQAQKAPALCRKMEAR